MCIFPTEIAMPQVTMRVEVDEGYRAKVLGCRTQQGERYRMVAAEEDRCCPARVDFCRTYLLLRVLKYAQPDLRLLQPTSEAANWGDKKSSL